MARRLELGLLAAMWVGALVGYLLLPERFPIHFDFAGNADGWAERGVGGFLVWMLLPVTATLVSLLMRWAPRAAESNPGLWNIPRKSEFLRLTPEQRAPIQRHLADSMAWMALMTTAMLAVLQASAFAAAHGHASGSTLAGLVSAFMIATVVFAWRSTKRARAEIDRILDRYGADARRDDRDRHDHEGS